MNEEHAAGLKKNKKKYRPPEKILIFSVAAWFCIMIIIPFSGILGQLMNKNWKQSIASLISPAALHAFGLTLLICVSVVIINTVFGIIAAIVLSRQKFRGKLLLESILDLPFAISPVVIGFMLIILFGPYGWLGNILIRHNIKITYAVPGMIIATLFVTLPFISKEIIPVLRQFGTEQEEAARVLGANSWQIFWRITYPTIKWSLGYGITLTIARSLGEFGAVLVVSGNIIKKTQSATLYIHDQFTDLNYQGAFAASMVLILGSILVIHIIQFINKKKRG
jgi:sulfate transport system permease protein